MLSFAGLAAGDPFVLYPKDGRNQCDTEIVTSSLRATIDDPSTLYISASVHLGVIFWSAEMTYSQAAELATSPLVFLSMNSIFLARRILLLPPFNKNEIEKSVEQT